MTLTSRQRVAAAIRGEPVDRTATGPLAVHYCAELIGASLKQYTLSAETLSGAVIRYADLFESDAVWVSADTWVTAEAMGAHVAFADDNQPLSGNGAPRIQSVADLQAIPAPDVSRHGRYPLMTEATRRVREKVGDDRFVVTCFDQHPFSSACALMGVERAMTALLQEPALLKDTMQKAADYAVAYGKALADAGPICSVAETRPAGCSGPTPTKKSQFPSNERWLLDSRKKRGCRFLSTSAAIRNDCCRRWPKLVRTFWN